MFRLFTIQTALLSGVTAKLAQNDGSFNQTVAPMNGNIAVQSLLQEATGMFKELKHIQYMTSSSLTPYGTAALGPYGNGYGSDYSYNSFDSYGLNSPSSKNSFIQTASYGSGAESFMEMAVKKSYKLIDIKHWLYVPRFERKSKFSSWQYFLLVLICFIGCMGCWCFTDGIADEKIAASHIGEKILSPDEKKSDKTEIPSYPPECPQQER